MIANILRVVVVLTLLSIGVLLALLNIGSTPPQVPPMLSPTAAPVVSSIPPWYWVVLLAVVLLTALLVMPKVDPDSYLRWIKPVVIIGFVLLAIAALHNSAPGHSFKRWAISVEECLQNPECRDSNIEVHKSGARTALSPHLTKEYPKVFKFSGQVNLYNYRPCSLPWIESLDPKELKVLPPTADRSLTVLQAPPGKSVEVYVWLKHRDPCN